MRTIEAVIDEAGNVRLVEAVQLPATYRALVTILEEEPPVKPLRPFGLCAGEFVVPDDFDASPSHLSGNRAWHDNCHHR